MQRVRINQHYLEFHKQVWTVAGLSHGDLAPRNSVLWEPQGWGTGHMFPF